MHRSLRFAALAVAVVLSACSKDSTAPVTAASVSLSNSTTVSGTVGTVLTPAPTFVAKDASGNALSGVPVTVTVSSGGGTLTGAPTTSSAGGTAVGTWTLGTTAGPNVLTITANGAAPITLTATGVAGAATKMTTISGTGQTGLANTVLPQPVVMRVTDQYGNGVAGQQVVFTLSGGGSLSGSGTVTTDLGGNATAPSWTLGKLVTAQTMTATWATTSTAITATVQSSYVVDVRFWGPTMPAATQQIFINAAARIRGAVIGQLTPVNLSNYDVANAGGCAVTGQAPLTEQPTGVIIFASIGPIDGKVGGIIGRAGPCAFRSSNLLPVIGVMQFDELDIQNLLTDGRFADVVLHEMLHVVGIGTMWDPSFKNLRVNGGTANTAYTGAQAITGCLAVNGGGVCTPTIPLENTGGAGTADGHWRESVFKTELMTGFVSGVGIANPFSAMTIGAIADLGYTTNSAAADTYTVPSAAGIQFGLIREAQGAPNDYRDELIIPTHSISPNGQVTRIVRKP